jgi:selenoprotein W-related protein
VSIDGQEIYDRKKEVGFPETKNLKQIVRDVVNPEKDLGHSDKPWIDSP